MLGVLFRKKQPMEYPPTLYKYRTFNEHSLKLLNGNEVFFSAPNRLNDPRDCKIPILYEKGTLQQIYKMNLENLKYVDPRLNSEERKRKARELAKTVYANRNDSKRREAFLNDLYEDINKTVGILSLSAVNDDTLMWAHYADGHRGFCVGFDTQKLRSFCKIVEHKGIFIWFDKINYHEKLPQIDPYKMTDQELVTTMTYSKSARWSYEEEYRLMCADRSDYLIKIDPNIISHVLLGSSCSEDNRLAVIDILKSRVDNIPLSIAVQKENEGGITFKQIKYT